MKFLLKFLFALFILALAVIITGLFLNDKHKLVIKETMPVSREILFEQVNDFSKWDNWQPWKALDTSMQVTVSELHRGKGASMQWSSSVFGDCNVSITHSVYPESIALIFDFGLSSKTIALIYFEPVAEGTLINYTMNLTKLNIWERYLVRLQQKKLHETITLGMDRLGETASDLKYSRLGEISVEESTHSHAVIKVDSATTENLNFIIDNDLRYLNRFFERREIVPGDTVFRLVYGPMNDTLTKFAVGRTMSKKTWVWKTIEYYRFPAGKLVSVSHFGKTDTKKAHDAIQAFIKQNGFNQNGTPWEIDRYNPQVDKDTSLWEIKVFYPVN